jgi:hypothetical protein
MRSRLPSRGRPTYKSAQGALAEEGRTRNHPQRPTEIEAALFHAARPEALFFLRSCSQHVTRRRPAKPQSNDKRQVLVPLHPLDLATSCPNPLFTSVPLCPRHRLILSYDTIVHASTAITFRRYSPTLLVSPSDRCVVEGF